MKTFITVYQISQGAFVLSVTVTIIQTGVTQSLACVSIVSSGQRDLTVKDVRISSLEMPPKGIVKVSELMNIDFQG